MAAPAAAPAAPDRRRANEVAAAVTGQGGVLDRPECSAIVVSYNVAPQLARCLHSITAEYERSGTAGEIIVVDNASHDGSADIVRTAFPHVYLIEAPRNEGFTAGCRQGMAVARGERILFINPDAELLPGALAALLACLRDHPAAAVAVPMLVDGDARPQRSLRCFPRLATLFVESTVVQWWWPSYPLLRGYYEEDRSHALPRAVDWAEGACWLVRRIPFTQMGGFDTRFFMYFEELDAALRLHRAGWEMRYTPEARVIHHGSQSADQNLLARDFYFHQSKYQFVRKWWGTGAVVTLRGFIALTVVVQLVEQALKWLLRGVSRPPVTVSPARRHARRLAILWPMLIWHVSGRSPLAPERDRPGATSVSTTRE